MAILQSCCCWQSVRKGSYASALYTISYFSLSCIIMGITVHHDMEYYWRKNNVTEVKPKNASFLEPAEISPLTMVYYVITLILSIFGIFASILLIIGLYFEIRWLLTPWMVIVSASSFVDVTHSIYWLTLDDPSFNPLTAVFFTVELFIFILNVYATLCVFSQYQEYKAGRGTAAYDTLLDTIRRQEQMPSLSVRCSQQQTTGTSYLATTTVSHYTRDTSQPVEGSGQNTSIVLDNVKSRRVQFTDNNEIKRKSPTKIEFDNQSSIHEESSDRVSDQEEDYSDGKRQYLWCDEPEDKVFIQDFSHPHHQEKDKHSRKKISSNNELAVQKSRKIFRKK